MASEKQENTEESPFTNFVVEDAEEKADEILRKARSEAEEILENTRDKAKAIREEAKNEGYEEGHSKGYDEGYEEGYREGKQEGERDVREEIKTSTESLKSTLKKITGEFESRVEGFEQAARRDLLELALEVAEIVTKTRAENNRDVLKQNLEKALDLASISESVTIFVPRGCREEIEEFLPDLKRTFQDLDHVEVEEDEDLDPGGCRVVTESGRVDADISTQLEEIKKQLLNERWDVQEEEETGDE